MQLPDSVLAARIVFAEAYPYFNPVLWGLRPVESPGLGTMAVDMWGRWYVDPVAVAEWPIEKIVFVLAHEVTHVVCNHPQRGQNYPDEDAPIYRMAAECACNSWVRAGLADADQTLAKQAENARKFQPIRGGQITALQLATPEEAIVPETFKLPDNLTVEEYVEKLREQAQQQAKQPQPQPGGAGQGKGSGQKQKASGAGQKEKSQEEAKDGSGDGGGENTDPKESQQGDGSADDPATKPHVGAGQCGSCSDGRQAPWEAPPPDEGGPEGLTESEIHVIRLSVAEAVKEHCRSRGTTLGHLQGWAIEFTGPPHIPWPSRLRALVRHGYYTIRGHLETTFKRPSRRSRDVFFPSLCSPVPVVAHIIDTSGSMNGELQADALREAQGALEACGRPPQVFLVVDMDVHVMEKLTDVHKLHLAGGGGTSMATGVRRALELKPRPNLVIVYTDGYTDHVSQDEIPYGVKVLYVLVGSNAPEPPEYIAHVHVDP